MKIFFKSFPSEQLWNLRSLHICIYLQDQTASIESLLADKTHHQAEHDNPWISYEMDWVKIWREVSKLNLSTLHVDFLNTRNKDLKGTITEKPLFTPLKESRAQDFKVRILTERTWPLVNHGETPFTSERLSYCRRQCMMFNPMPVLDNVEPLCARSVWDSVPRDDSKIPERVGWGKRRELVERRICFGAEWLVVMLDGVRRFF